MLSFVCGIQVTSCMRNDVPYFKIVFFLSQLYINENYHMNTNKRTHFNRYILRQN